MLFSREDDFVDSMVMRPRLLTFKNPPESVQEDFPDASFSEQNSNMVAKPLDLSFSLKPSFFQNENEISIHEGSNPRKGGFPESPFMARRDFDTMEKRLLYNIQKATPTKENQIFVQQKEDPHTPISQLNHFLRSINELTPVQKNQNLGPKVNAHYSEMQFPTPDMFNRSRSLLLEEQFSCKKKTSELDEILFPQKDSRNERSSDFKMLNTPNQKSNIGTRMEFLRTSQKKRLRSWKKSLNNCGSSEKPHHKKMKTHEINYYNQNFFNMPISLSNAFENSLINEKTQRSSRNSPKLAINSDPNKNIFKSQAENCLQKTCPKLAVKSVRPNKLEKNMMDILLNAMTNVNKKAKENSQKSTEKKKGGYHCKFGAGSEMGFNSKHSSGFKLVTKKGFLADIFPDHQNSGLILFSISRRFPKAIK